MGPDLFGEIMILLAANKLLKQTMHALLVLRRQTVAVQFIKVFLRQMINIHVVVSVLRLPVLLLPVVRMHDFDALRSFNLFILGCNDLLFTFFRWGLFDDWVAKVKVGDFCEHKGGEIVGVFTVAGAILSVKAVAAANNTENLDVLREQSVEAATETLLILSLIELDFARKHILQGVHFFVSACGSIPSYFLEVTIVVVGDGAHFMKGLFDFFFDRTDVWVFLRPRKVAPVVADDQSDSGLRWIDFAAWDSRLVFLVGAICFLFNLFMDIKVSSTCYWFWLVSFDQMHFVCDKN
jgi:hypothetical protein